MDAGKIYNSWPMMGSNFFPDDSKYSELLSLKVFDNPSIVQFLHRFLAYLIVINYIYLLILAFKEKNKVLLKPVLIIGIILLFQVGFYNKHRAHKNKSINILQFNSLHKKRIISS